MSIVRIGKILKQKWAENDKKWHGIKTYIHKSENIYYLSY